jgi:ATP-binding cassette subfamily C (CFTR/MRP) protein 4
LRLVNRASVEGEILIDDIDISRITLNHLRSHISVIPQHPVLFDETLRYNLDPFDQYTDQQCIDVLDNVQLQNILYNHPAGLLQPVVESGNNLSVGQRQLICIARAILKRSQILLIDEATSNIDRETEALIHSILANKFHDKTILTIAHRHSTIARCDRILLLDKGRIVKFDTLDNVLHLYQ